MSNQIKEFKGKVWKYGDNIDTDVIIPARYLSSSIAEELAPHCMEDVDASFANKVRAGDIIVAGNNFGCGSSREHAPLAIQGAKVSCVVAKSFARIFYRNAINIGLPIFECPDAVEGTQAGDELEVNMKKGSIINLGRDKTWISTPFPSFLCELIETGGLVPYVQKQFKVS